MQALCFCFFNFCFIIMSCYTTFCKGKRNILLSDQNKNHKTKHHNNELEGKQSYLWKIERNPPAYLFGTIHVPYNKVWKNIPRNSKKVLKSSQLVVFELDLNKKETIKSVERCQMLEGNKTLEQVIPSEIMNRLRNRIKTIKNQISEWLTEEQLFLGYSADSVFETKIGNWTKKRPVWIKMMLQSVNKEDIQRSYAPYLDLYLTKLASKNYKQISSIETVEEQCQIINKLDKNLAIFSLNSTLTQLEKNQDLNKRATKIITKLYNSLKLSDIDLKANSQSLLFRGKMNFTVNESTKNKKIDEYFNKNMNIQRNKKILNRLLKIIDDNKNKQIVFVFGVGHFLGEGSIVELIQSSGFNISRQPAEYHVNSSKRVYKSKKAAKRQHISENTYRTQEDWYKYLFHENKPTSSVPSNNNSKFSILTLFMYLLLKFTVHSF